MRVGIITLSASDNCGSLLQTYALKKLIEKYHKTDVINFSSLKSHQQYDIFPRGIYKKPQVLRKKLKMLGALVKEKKAYKKFRAETIGIDLSKEYLSKDLASVDDKYDIVVAGSDQVWNVCMSDFDNAFFAYWTKGRRVAYAPSLGGYDIRESKDYELIKKWLGEFDALSSREVQGKQCLEEVTGKEVALLLDPTLVLDPAEWEKLVGPPLIESEYIFYYSWAYVSKETSNIVLKDGEKTGLPIYVIDAHKWIANEQKKNFVLCDEAGPLAFLNLMYYAKRCYVESFHGMIFAYIFRKNFWLLDTHKDLSELDTRLREFVNLLNANERILTKYNYIEKNIEESIEYGENETLTNMRKISLEYIERIMK